MERSLVEMVFTFRYPGVGSWEVALRIWGVRQWVGMVCMAERGANFEQVRLGQSWKEVSSFANFGLFCSWFADRRRPNKPINNSILETSYQLRTRYTCDQVTVARGGSWRVTSLSGSQGGDHFPTSMRDASWSVHHDLKHIYRSQPCWLLIF